MVVGEVFVLVVSVVLVVVIVVAGWPLPLLGCSVAVASSVAAASGGVVWWAGWAGAPSPQGFNSSGSSSSAPPPGCSVAVASSVAASAIVFFKMAVAVVPCISALMTCNKSNILAPSIFSKWLWQLSRAFPF